MTKPRLAHAILATLTLAIGAFAQEARQPEARNSDAPRRVRQLDARPAPEKGELLLSVLTVQEVKAVTESLKPIAALYDQPFLIVPNEKSNRIVVATYNADDLKAVTELAKLLDAHTEFGEATIRGYSLSHADAKDVAHHLHELFPHERNLRIAADERTNALWIVASESLMERISALIENLDKAVDASAQSATPSQEQLRVYAPKFADARSIAGAAVALLPAELRSARILASDNDRLVVAGSEEAQAWVQDLVGKLDIESARPAAVPERPHGHAVPSDAPAARSEK